MKNEKQAFPVNDAGQLLDDGMTLRDYFAAKALPAIYLGAPTGTPYTEAAQKAYAIADAMMKERENVSEEG